MTLTYELHVHSRNVDALGTSVGSHTGYNLITRDETGNIVNIQSVELMGTFPFNGSSYFVDYNSSHIVQSGDIIAPDKIFKDGQWQDVDITWLESNNYKNINIPMNSSDAQNIFNQIKLFADLTNKLYNQGLKFDYETAGQNCNSFTNYINQALFPNIDIWNILGEGTYIGKDYPFGLFDNSSGIDLLKLINELLNYLDENNLTLDDINLSVSNLLYGYEVTVDYAGEQIVFTSYLSFATPVYSLQELYDTAERTTSPLIVDLDGDGVETTSVADGVYFDHDGNGFAEKSAWVSKDDGLLVRDINGNGQIDNGTELFGNNSVLSNGQKAANGFEALKDLDSNKDGVFDNQDSAWGEVKVWKDSNSNGIVDAGELMTLEQAGITGFNLDYQTQSRDDANGNAHLQTSTITKADGTTAAITDVWFKTDTANSIDTMNITIPDDIKALPDVAGFGNVHSLHIAMALDESGELKALVEQYAAETDKTERAKILDNIIYHWAGVQDEDPRGRDPLQVYGQQFDDCRQLEALEEFMGRDYLGTWCWGDRDPNPHEQASPYLIRAYNILKNYVDSALLPQTHYKSTLENIPLTYDATTREWTADASSLLNEWQTSFDIRPAATVDKMKEFYNILSYFGDNALPIINAIRAAGSNEGNSYQNALLNFGQWENVGTDGNDFLEGDNADNYLNGGKGDDSLFGNGGDDLLIGGEGNDYLVGGDGDDIYHFDPGFGNDTLDNFQDESQPNNDIIRFGEGISPDKVTLNRQGFDLIIIVSYDEDENGYTRPDDSLRVYSYFNKQGMTSTTVSKIVFSDEDETTWTYEYVRDNWNSMPDVFGGLTLEGNDEDNGLYGTAANDIFIGNGGNDSMYGNNGNDRFLGGKGDDIINAGNGNDTFIWNLGDGLDTITDGGGHDKISFGPGIRFEDLSFSLVSGHRSLKITVKGDETQGIILNNHMGNQPDYKIEDLYFYDGSIVHLSEIPLTLRQNSTQGEILYLSDNGDTVYAGSGDDYIDGGMGDDTIIGGKGWDVINGSSGKNTYIWNQGDGFDTITCDYESDETVKFGPGITFADLTFRLGGISDRLVIHVNGDETQGMEVIRQAYLHYLKFADGTVIDLKTTPLTYYQTDAEENSLNGNDLENTYYCGGGDDRITGGRGNDTFIGGKGNDFLYGWEGDDTYVWNLGDGMDTINDYYGTNIIQFGEGICFNDLTFERSDYDWRIYVKGDRSQGMKFNQCEPHILKFADGSSYDLREHGITVHNSDNDDNVTGTNMDDIVYGGGGNDSITTLDGNDTLIGGKGNDALNGGRGDDTYIWNLGDGFDAIYDESGNDKIKFGEGIALEDLSFARDPNGSLEIYVKGDRSQGVSINSFFVDTGYQVETLEFADGTTFDLAGSDIELVDYQQEYLDNRYATEEMTEMNGSDGSDQMTNRYDYSVTFNGGKGNDHYNGGGGADTYIYNLGDGLDYIYDNSNDNILKFGEGISYSDLSFRTTYNGQLFIFVDSEMSQGLQLSNSKAIKYFEFADGSIVNFHDMKLAVHQSNKDEELEINDDRFTTLYMGDGDGRVYNRVGHEMTVVSGKGNDEINSYYGTINLVWNRGDGIDYFTADNDDKIIFGEGITAEDLTFRNDNSGLHIIVDGDENQGIILRNYSFNNPNEIKNIYFSDGTHIDLSLGIVLHQTNADDVLNIGYGNTAVYCGAGNDEVLSYRGDNIYIGGTGNDKFEDWNGDDTYIYNLGDGFDTINDEGGNDKIVFGKGISADDLSFARDGDDLKIIIDGDNNSGMRIMHQFWNDGHTMETIEFHDGSTLDISNADQLVQAMNSFSLSNSASTDTLSNPTQDVSEMYGLAANSELNNKAV